MPRDTGYLSSLFNVAVKTGRSGEKYRYPSSSQEQQRDSSCVFNGSGGKADPVSYYSSAKIARNLWIIEKHPEKSKFRGVIFFSFPSSSFFFSRNPLRSINPLETTIVVKLWPFLENVFAPKVNGRRERRLADFSIIVHAFLKLHSCVCTCMHGRLVWPPESDERERGTGYRSIARRILSCAGFECL